MWKFEKKRNPDKNKDVIFICNECKLNTPYKPEDKFTQRLSEYHKTKGNKKDMNGRRNNKIGRIPIPIYSLYNEVLKRGGKVLVSKGFIWTHICKLLPGIFFGECYMHQNWTRYTWEHF